MRSVALAPEIRMDGAPGMGLGMEPVVDEIDLLRAHQYDLLAAVLGRVPTQGLLDRLAAFRGDASTLGRLHTALGQAASETGVVVLEREFFRLFVGVGRGELLPYASYYLTGFLNERPLARVREDLAALGIERDDGVSEPEDHVAILLETMAGLAAGRFDAEPGAERRFFDRHLAPWAARLFGDLEASQTSRFYRAVGALGRAFIEIETEAFAMDA